MTSGEAPDVEGAVYCGDCGEKVGSAGCCVNTQREEEVLSIATPAGEVVVGVDGEPDSDHEEETKELFTPGQDVETPEGKGVIIERYDGGGLLAWFVAVKGKGDRLMEVGDLCEAETEEIKRSVKRKRNAPDPPTRPRPSSRQQGTITKWYSVKGFGFITSTGKPIWVSQRIAKEELKLGMQVTFTAEDTKHPSGYLICTSVASAV